MSKFWSFPKAPKNTLGDSTSKFNNIGPGSYNAKITSVKKNEPVWSFPKDRRGRSKAKNVPGPGSYNSNGQPKRVESAISMASRINDKYENIVPGPGKYNPKLSHLKGSSKFTFSGKLKNTFGSNRDNPAPGSYNPNIDSVKKGTTMIQFPKAKRNKNSKKEKLGPGSYNIKGELGKVGGYMSQVKKGILDGDNKVPGPGTYNMNFSTVNIQQNKAAMMKSRYKSPKQDNKVPGPGQYNPNLNAIKKRPNSCKFGLDKKIKYNKNDVPGAGTYNPDDTITKKGFTMMRFGTDKAIAVEKPNGVPGPGNYNFVNDIGEGTSKISFGGRAKLKVKNLNPGPGQYNPSVDGLSNMKKTRVSSALPRERRFVEKPDGMPGPGIYNPDKLSKNNNVVFGKDKKIKFNKSKKFVPGPGTYNFETQFEEGMKKGRGFSLRKKDKQLRPTTCVPGPGQYSSNLNSVKKNSSKISFGKNKRFKVKSEVGCKVDPGRYNPNKPRPSSNVVFGKDKRFSNKDDRKDSPAPNHYNPEKPQKNIKYSMRPKTAVVVKSTNPGPGQYNPNVDPTKKVEKGSIFSKSKKDYQKKSKKEIGPGQYNISGDMKGKTYSFGKQKKGFNLKKEGPGPGSYNPGSDLSDIPSYIRSTLKGRLGI